MYEKNTHTKIPHAAGLLKIFSPTRMYYIFVQIFVHILRIKKVCAGLNCACAWRASLFDDSCALWLLLKGGENLTTEGFLSLSFAARTFGGLERELNCTTHPYQSRLNSVLHTQPSSQSVSLLYAGSSWFVNVTHQRTERQLIVGLLVSVMLSPFVFKPVCCQMKLLGTHLGFQAYCYLNVAFNALQSGVFNFFLRYKTRWFFADTPTLAAFVVVMHFSLTVMLL